MSTPKFAYLFLFRFDRYQADCTVPWINDVLLLLTVALQTGQQLKAGSLIFYLTYSFVLNIKKFSYFRKSTYRFTITPSDTINRLASGILRDKTLDDLLIYMLIYIMKHLDTTFFLKKKPLDPNTIKYSKFLLRDQSV